MAKDFSLYINTGDACSRCDQYFIIGKQLFISNEPEETKCDKNALQREKWANYEYSDEEE